MQELIDKLTEKAGISTEQAHKSIDTIKEFIKEKFPMMAGAVDNLFPAQSTSNTNAASAGSSSIMDKISDFIPGEAGEKVEAFAKEKLSGLFGDGKKS